VQLLVLFRKFKYASNARMWDILNSYTQFVPHISMKSTLAKQRSDRETDTQVRCCLTRIFYRYLDIKVHITKIGIYVYSFQLTMRTTFGNIYSRVYQLEELW